MRQHNDCASEGELLALINLFMRQDGPAYARGALVDELWDRYCELATDLGFVSADGIGAGEWRVAA